MTAPVTRFTIATPVPSATRTGGYDMAYTDVVLASDYERLEQECERLREALQSISKQAAENECRSVPCSREQRQFADIMNRAAAALQAKP